MSLPLQEALACDCTLPVHAAGVQLHMVQGASTPIASGVGLCHMLSDVIVTFMDPLELPMHHVLVMYACISRYDVAR